MTILHHRKTNKDCSKVWIWIRFSSFTKYHFFFFLFFFQYFYLFCKYDKKDLVSAYIKLENIFLKTYWPKGKFSINKINAVFTITLGTWQLLHFTIINVYSAIILFCLNSYKTSTSYFYYICMCMQTNFEVAYCYSWFPTNFRSFASLFTSSHLPS